MSTSRKPAKASEVVFAHNAESIEFLDPDSVLLDKNNPRVLPILAARTGWTNPSQKQLQRRSERAVTGSPVRGRLHNLV